MLVNFRGYVVEMSMPGLVIVLVLAYLFVRAIVAVVDAPRRWDTSPPFPGLTDEHPAGAPMDHLLFPVVYP